MNRRRKLFDAGPRVLVTGGAGFLGSHMCEFLLSKGFTVLCMDNLLTGAFSNLEALLSHPSFRFIRHDISTGVEVDGPLDYVLHLACPASPKDYMAHPVETLRVGSFGTHYALEIARIKGARVLMSSTSEVYGDPEVNPQPETYWGRVNPVGPRSVYDEAKRFSEALASAYFRVCGLDVRIARLFNVYGPRMRLRDGRVLPAFMSQALANEPLTIYGDGSQTRSLCYVDDMVDGLFRLMTCNVSDGRDREKNAPPPIVNLGNPEEVTVRQLAEEIIEATDSDSDIVFMPLPEDDPRKRCPDIAKAGALLDWRPRVSRREGLEKVVPYFRSALQEAGTLRRETARAS